MSKKGFTLIEILVVISIIAILSTLGLVSFTTIRTQALNAKKKADVDAITQAYETKFDPSANNGQGGYRALVDTDFSSGKIPTPPDGGQYSILQNKDTTGFIICTALSNNPPCGSSSSTCICKSSTQEPPPSSTANTTYVTNGNLIGSDYLGNGFDNRFATAGQVGSLLDTYYYIWDNMSDPTPPSQSAAVPNHKFAWVVGKIDFRHDGLSCGPCSQINLDNIYNAESPKITSLLTNNVNKGGVWIVGNEANCCPLIDPILYANQFKKYYDLIRSKDSTAKITTAGMLYYYNSVTNGPSYLNSVFASLPANVRPDIYNVHFYPGGINQSDFNLNVSQAQNFKSYVNSIDLGKPIWVTEFGINTPASNFDTNQYMYTMLNYFMSDLQYQRWFWFISDAGTTTDWYQTALLKNSQLTPVGTYYKAWASSGSQAAPLTPSAPPTVEKLTNGSFESSLTPNWNCQGDLTSGGNGTCVLDSTTKFAGNSSSKVTRTVGNGWGWQVAQNNITASAGDHFCLSAQVKKQNASDTVSIALQEGGGAWREIDFYASSTTNWQLIKNTVVVANDWVTPVQVFLRVWNTGGAAWFDEVSLLTNSC